jgi:DNA-binding NarL/FixJ family response regulator
MARTLILGNDPNAFWRSQTQGIELREVPDYSINDVNEISEFLAKNISTDVEKLIIDTGSIDTDLALNLALQVRLMLHTLKQASLCCVIFISDFDLLAFSGHGVGSLLLMTIGIKLSKPEDIGLAIDNSRAISATEYIANFLNLIKIVPQENIAGHHSIANEWGARMLGRIIGCNVQPSFNLLQSLYFKYAMVASLTIDDVNQIINGNDIDPPILTVQGIDAPDYKWLLIDDEADKGWETCLAKLLAGAEYEVYKGRANDYSDLPEALRNKIQQREFDIIFLDYRMNGAVEETKYNPGDFSGMKILKAIKSNNPGTQVIMLTATNKSWNVRAMLNAGANGYYMKESPEYHFSVDYSAQNANALCDTIMDCMNNAYLQDIYYRIISLQLPNNLGIKQDILTQLKLSFDLISRAQTEPEYAYAYIALNQVFEICSAYYIKAKWSNTHNEYFFTNGKEQCKLYRSSRPEGDLISIKGEKQAAQWKKIAAIYYQLFEGRDDRFAGDVEKLIDLRNKYVHNSKWAKAYPITSEDYQALFEVVMEFLNVIE